MSTEQTLTLFRDLMTCGDDLFLWQYDNQLELLESNCPKEFLMDVVFQNCGFKDGIFKHASQSSTPLVLSLQLGLVWIAAFEMMDERLIKIHIIGPAFSANVLPETIVQTLGESYPVDAPLAWKWELIQIFEKLPVVAPLVLSRYARMLHFCINQEKIGEGDIASLISQESAGELKGEPMDRRQFWRVEETLLNKIRLGDPNYKPALELASIIRSKDLPQFRDPLRQAKNTAIIFVSLCTRAAIDGGLTTEQAYALGDGYLQSIENCNSVADVEVINYTMYKAMIQAVYRMRHQDYLSRHVRACCDFIDFHVEEKIDINRLARHTGLTNYYLSRKFKEEVGLSVNDYVKKAKIEKAKLLLSTTDLGIDSIADRLNFSSRSFFADTFRKLVGQPPAEYRQQHQKI